MDIAIELGTDGGWQKAGGWVGRTVASPAEGFDVAWEETAPLRRARIRRRDGAALEVARIKVTVSLPLLNFAHVVVPDCGRHYVNASKALDIRAPLYRVTASNAGHPFFALADEAGRFLAAFGVVSPTGETEIRRVLPRISRRKAMVGGDHQLTLEMTWSGSATAAPEISLVFYVQDAAATWVHALREYSEAIREAERVAYPSHPGAWNPVWCTWTAFCSSEMTAQRVLDNARVAHELGVGTVILDDGWFGTGLDDDHGTLNLGDYEPDPRKFPDLRGHVGELQALGLKVLLWHAPLCVAPSSRTYGRLRQLLIHQHGREFVSVNGLGMLCPACPEVRQYVADETRRLFAAYGVDGLKADLYNCLPVGPCESTAHSHDVADGVGAVEAVMEAQWAAAREARPDALVELKQDYASVRLARYGTMVRAGDTAYDVDTNCRRCFYAQAYAPCVHNDYFVTSRHATPRAVALAMIRMLAAGVPTFGGDWLTTPAEQQNIIRAWLDLYRRKIGIFRLPREPQTNDLSAWQGGNAVEAWVAAIWNGREIRLPEAGSVVVMNGTDRDDLYLRLPHPSHAEIETVDFRGRSAGQSRMRVTDGGRVAIPSGGRAEITVTASESSSLSLP